MICRLFPDPITAGHLISPPVLPVFIVFLSTSAVLFLISYRKCSRILLKIVIFISLPIFIITGILSYSNFYLGNRRGLLHSIHHMQGDLDVEINVRGRVEDHVRFYGNRMFFSIRTDSVTLRDIGSGLERTIITKEIFPATIKSDSPGLLIRDDYISFRCQIEKDRDNYYLQGFQSGVEITESGSLAGRLFNLRSRAYNCLECLFYLNLEYTAASFCEAVILGNTANLPERVSTDVFLLKG